MAMPAARRAQRGATLLVALMMLVVLAIMGVAAVSSAMLEERMSSGAIDRKIAFEAAEAALRDGETYAYSTLSPGSAYSAGCNAGLCLPSVTVQPVWESVDWQGGAVLVYGSQSAAAPLSGVLQQPRFIVEYLSDVQQTSGTGLSFGTGVSTGTAGSAYRITAMGWGKQPGTQVMLQSIFTKL